MKLDCPAAWSGAWSYNDKGTGWLIKFGACATVETTNCSITINPKRPYYAPFQVNTFLWGGPLEGPQVYRLTLLFPQPQ